MLNGGKVTFKLELQLNYFGVLHRLLDLFVLLLQFLKFASLLFEQGLEIRSERGRYLYRVYVALCLSIDRVLAAAAFRNYFVLLGQFLL